MASVPESRQGRAYRREEIEGLLRDALTTLMSDGTPFAGLTVDRFTTTAGMSRSTFYKYFEDKSGLLQALSASALKRLYAAQRLWIRQNVDITRDDIRQGMRTLFDAYLEEEAVMRAVAEASTYDTAIREAYVDGVADYARGIERFIRAGQERGTVRDVHPRDTALAIAWMTERTTSQLAPGASKRRLDTLADSLAGIVAAALLV